MTRRGPAPGSWLRWAVVRGDATTVGVVLVALGLGLGLSVPVGDRPPWMLAVGLTVSAAGAFVVRRARAAWRTLVREVVEAHAGHDPGPSPVAWVHDEVWRSANRFDPALDAPMRLRAEVERGFRAFGDDSDGAFVTVHLRPVRADEAALVPGDGEPATAVPPEGGDGETMRARLAATPGRRIVVEPVWPVCCGRPSVLVSVRPDARDRRARFLAGPTGGPGVGEDDAAWRGVHGYRCATCGRRWATDPAW